MYQKMIQEIFFIFIISMALISFIYDEQQIKGMRVMKILNVLSGFSIVVLIYSNYLNTNNYNNNTLRMEEEKTINFTKKYWVDLNEKIRESYLLIPEFCKSLLYSIDDILSTEVKDSSEHYLLKRDIALNIFQSWDEFLISFGGYNDHFYKNFLRVFIQNGRSLELKEFWQKEKYSYRSGTKQLGDIIFNQFNQGTIQSLETDVDKLSVIVKSLLKEERKIILENRSLLSKFMK